MTRPPAAAAHDLLRRIVDREPAALVRLHDLMVGSVLDHVTAEIGDADAAPAITRAVFHEVWRLAPVLGAHRDADTWLATIAARRSTDHLRAGNLPQPITVVYNRHIAAELAAVLAAGAVPDRVVFRRSPEE